MIFDVYESKKATVFRIMAATLFIIPLLNELGYVMFNKPELTSIVWLLADLFCLIGLFLAKKGIIIIGNILISTNYLLLFFSRYNYELLAYLIPYILTIIALLVSSSKEPVIKNGIKPLSCGICLLTFAANLVVPFIEYGTQINNIVWDIFGQMNAILSLVFTNLWNAEISKEE